MFRFLSVTGISFALSFSAALAADRVLVEASLPFDMTTDSLCFKNGDPDLAKTGIPILGRLGVKKGVCQGMAGVAAAFRENVDFVPAAPKDSAANVERAIKRAVSANRRGSRARTEIRGFANLVDLCRANRMAFLKKSVWLNTEIAVADIVPLYPTFNRLKNSPIETEKHPEALRRALSETLRTALGELRDGRYPLLLYFSHVVLVRSYSEVEAVTGERRIELGVYDSNQPDRLRTIPIPLGPDGLPSGTNPMHWVLSATH